MSRTRNANESLLEFRRIRESYRNHIHPLIKKIKEAYAGQVEKGLVDESLEAHVRVHVVNCLLAALNWRLDVQPGDGLPSLLPEAPIRSTATKTVRFFDYLGLETKSAEPLLVVETKRPSALLPRIPKSLSTYSEVVSQGLSGEELSGEWNKWLKDLQDYVRSTEEAVQKTPKRVVMTNGDWLIAFLDPSGAFLAEGEADPKMILVFESSSDIEARFNELFLQLEHQQVLGTAPPLTPGEMGFHLVPAMVDRVMHGLLVRYIEERRLYRTLPTITVAPVLLIRSVYGAWLRIETPPLEYELPREQRQLPQHLHDVDQAGTDLLSDASRRLGTSLQPLSLAKHYEDEDAFQPIRGVSECREESEYLLVTGDRCHYLLQASAVSDCPYHDWTACN